MKNMRFTIPWKALYLDMTTHALNLFFMKHTFNTRSEKRMSYKTPVLRTLLYVCEIYVNERTLNMRYSIHVYHTMFLKRTLHIFLCTTY